MSIYDDILSDLHRGDSPASIAKSYSWDAIPTDERNALLQAVRDLGDSQEGFDLLRVLFKLSRDDWYTVRVLIAIIQHPQLNTRGRQGALKALDRYLTRFENNDARSSKIGISTKKLRCQYYYLQGNFLLQSGDFWEAISCLQSALAISQELGALAFAERIDKVIKTALLSNSALPDGKENQTGLQLGVSGSNNLDTQSIDRHIEQQRVEKEKHLEELDITISEKEAQIDSLNERNNKIRSEVERLEKKLEGKRKVNDQLTNPDGFHNQIEMQETRVEELIREIEGHQRRDQELQEEIKRKEVLLVELTTSIQQIEQRSTGLVEQINDRKASTPSIKGLEGDVPAWLTD